MNIRKAEPKDIIIGQEIVLVGDDEQLFIKKIDEVLNPSDEWKAYVAEDGCRYGLEGSWIIDHSMNNNKDMNDLLNYMLLKRYKELCDAIKVKILDKLIDVALTKNKGSECITFFELEHIKRAIDDARNKEYDEQIKTLKSVIDSLISRGDDAIKKVNL